jgi:hypothetical protein
VRGWGRGSKFGGLQKKLSALSTLWIPVLQRQHLKYFSFGTNLETLAVCVLDRRTVRRAGRRYGPARRRRLSLTAAAAVRILELLVQVDLALLALQLLGEGEEGDGDEEDEDPADEEAAPPHPHPVPDSACASANEASA